MRVLPLTLLNPWNQKEGDESTTSHPSETWNQKQGDESITSHPDETWNQHESWQTTNIWCMMKVLDKKHVICSWNLQGFLHFFYFFDIYGFPALLVFCGGGEGRAIKSKFERWTLVMRVLPHFCFFSNMTSQSQPTKITARVQLLTACKPLCLKPMRIEL